MGRVSRSPLNISKIAFKDALEKGYSDPVFFAHHFLEMDVHEGQEAWLLRTGTPWMPPEERYPKRGARESVLACGNRFGKTELIAVGHLHRAFYLIRPGRYVLDNAGRINPWVSANVSLSLDQAMIGWNYAIRHATNSPRFKRFVYDVQNAPFPCITISNGLKGENEILSNIWARSTAKGARFLLGKAFNLVTWDEAAFQVDGEEILGGVIRMRVVDQAGDIEAYTSPNGKNWLYRWWLKGRGPDPRYYSQQGRTYDNTFLDPEEIRLQEAEMTEEERLQNVYGEFAEGSSIFDTISLGKCYQNQDYAHLMGHDGLPPDTMVIYIDHGERGIEAKLRPAGHTMRYAMGVDLATRRDMTAIEVISIPDNPSEPCQLVFYDCFGRQPWRAIYDRIFHIRQRYHNCPVKIDETGIGAVVLEALKSDPYFIDNVSGYMIGGKAEKERLVLDLQLAVQDTRVVFPMIRQLVNSLMYYQWQDERLFTDPMMGLALAWQQALAMGMDTRGSGFITTSGYVVPVGTMHGPDGRLHVSGLPHAEMSEEERERRREEALARRRQERWVDEVPEEEELRAIL